MRMDNDNEEQLEEYQIIEQNDDINIPLPPPPPPIYSMFKDNEEEKENMKINENNLIDQRNKLKPTVILRNKEEIDPYTSISMQIQNGIKERTKRMQKTLTETQLKTANQLKEDISQINFVSLQEAIKIFQKAKQFEKEFQNTQIPEWPSQNLASIQLMLNIHQSIELSLTNSFNIIQNKLGKNQKVIGSIRSPDNLRSNLDILLNNSNLIQNLIVENEGINLKLKIKLQIEKTMEFTVKLVGILFGVIFDMYDSIEKCMSKFDKSYKIKNTFNWINKILEYVLLTKTLLRQKFIFNQENVLADFLYTEEEFIKNFELENAEKVRQMKTHLVENYGEVLNYKIIGREEHPMKLGYNNLKLNNSGSFNLKKSGSNTRIENNENKNKEEFPVHYYSSLPLGFQEIEKILDQDHKKKEKLNQVDNKGLTPLFVSILQNMEKNVLYFIENSCDVNSKDINGNTILHISIQKSFNVISSVLLSNLVFTSQFDINNKNSKGETVLHLLARNNNLSLLLKIIQTFKQVDLFSQDLYNRTPFELLSVKSNISFSPPKKNDNQTMDFSSYFNNQSLSDLTFVFEPHHEKPSIFAHRIILCGQSEPFKQMLGSESWSENKEREVLLKDVDPLSFHHFLSSCYKGHSELNSLKYTEDIVFGILKLSDRFLVRWLKEECEFCLSEKITLENCYWMFESVKSLDGLTSLKLKLSQFILNNYHTIQNDDDFSVISSVLSFLSLQK
eukprot:TRINITY_DN6625_c0_g1_i1.p1 TRINITY_DN6625_c0_g1~~TRINITY_DN6625_c0_g1_i1.p1  ORF type:complete len:754 (-),score=227.64 TRINITY_DN6625_c0_g1_i1:44-2236(-)